MKGLILAGGSGRRLRPFSHSGAKQLVPVANRPILFYGVDALVAAGITEIGVILAPATGDEVRAALGSGERFAARFTFIVQDHPGGLAHAVLVARDFLGQDPFVMYLGDNLIGEGIAGLASQFAGDEMLSALILVTEVADPGRFGVVELDDRGGVVGLAEKPAIPASNLALIGIYFFRPAIFDAIAAIAPSARGELEITDAIAALIARGGACRVARTGSFWLDTGKKDDLLLANDTVLDSWLVAGVHGQVDDRSQLDGPVAVAAGARIERSHIQGPVIVGAGARVIDAIIEPHTAIGDGAHIERARVGHSIIMADARVTGIDGLRDSVIGRRVRVARGQDISLVLGDDSIVELSGPPGPELPDVTLSGQFSSQIDGVRLHAAPGTFDPRGEFREAFRQSWFPGPVRFVQSNVSRSRPNVLRGMHYHLEQDDLWVFVRGHVTVALADLRGARPRRVECFVPAPGLGVFIPRGVAHGFYAHDEIMLLYHVTREYDGSDEHGVAWNDPELAIPWPCSAPILSARDRANPVLAAIDRALLPP